MDMWRQNWDLRKGCQEQSVRLGTADDGWLQHEGWRGAVRQAGRLSTQCAIAGPACAVCLEFHLVSTGAPELESFALFRL
jgi:hypothetical protein